MKKINQLLDVTPIISKENIRNFILQSEILYYKEEHGLDVSDESIKNLIEDRTERLLIQWFSDLFTGSNNGIYITYGLSSIEINNRIILNLKALCNPSNYKNGKDVNGLSPEQKICETISHETIHLVLNMFGEINTSRCYDKIYRRLRKDGFTGC